MSNKAYTKRNLFFHFLSGICLFSVLFLGSWNLYGPFNVRNFTSICVFIIALLFPTLYPALNSITKTYIIWLAVYILINMFSGNASSTSFIRGLLTYHLLSVFTILSVPRIVNDSQSFTIIARWIIVFYIFNAVITILQFHDNSFAWAISQVINPMSEAGVEQLGAVNQMAEGYVGKSIIPGINGFVVSNGYFLTCFLPFVTKGFGDKKMRNHIVAFILLVLGGYAVYCTQQRMAFYLTLFYVLYLVVFKSRSITKVAIAVLLLTYFAFIANSPVNLDQFGRIFSLEDEIRSQTWPNLLFFVSDPLNLILGMHEGGAGSESVLILETMSHNSMLDALRRGGILSLLIMFLLYVRMLFQCISITIKKEEYSNTTKSLALSCSLFLIYSLTHSTGLQSGSVECWLLYMLMLSSIALEKRKHGELII